MSSAHRRTLAMLVAVAATAAAPSARADSVLFYNGDYDNRGSLTNENDVPVQTGTNTYTIQKSLVYENFVVPVGQTWTVTSLFSNDLMSYYVPSPLPGPRTATWEIRSGVSAGIGGTLLFSGDTAATLTPTGYTANNLTENTVSTAVTGVTLTAGTYWMAVAPDSYGYYNDQSYVVTTSGANAVDSTGQDGNSFISNTVPATGRSHDNFTPTTTALPGKGTLDFSEGVVGTFSIVPEPSSVAMALVGLAGTLALTLRSKAGVA